MGMLASVSSKQTFKNYCERPVATKPAGADHGPFNPISFVARNQIWIFELVIESVSTQRRLYKDLTHDEAEPHLPRLGYYREGAGRHADDAISWRPARAAT